MTDLNPEDRALIELTRPIIGIENRTAQEAFDIMADRIRSAWRTEGRESRASGEAQPVGEAGEMPGSNGGFTLAAFKASDVPVGTKLYTAPREAWKPDREAVARIADHEGYWERLDSCNHALDTVQMNDDSRRALTAVRDDELRGTAESLAKADAIRALPSAPPAADRVPGESGQ